MARNLNILTQITKMANFGLIQLGNLYLGYVLPLCKISRNMDITNILKFLAIFANNFYYFASKIANFGSIQLG